MIESYKLTWASESQVRYSRKHMCEDDKNDSHADFIAYVDDSTPAQLCHGAT